ncbi:hypothetical protein QP166_03585 [Sphingomonas sp. LR60]|uniref:hypothetical protein n=1 Tax=Sphingomonas sp. LR60 TaxID=3050233 RepID=UPI002FE01B76
MTRRSVSVLRPRRSKGRRGGGPAPRADRDRARGDLHQRGDLIRRPLRAGEAHPLEDALARLCWRKVEPDEEEGVGPFAGQCERERKVLAGARIRAGEAHRRHQHLDALPRRAGERQREPAVGGGDQRGVARQARLRRVLLPAGDLREDEVERGRTVDMVERERIVERLRRRAEPAGAQVSGTEQGTSRAVAAVRRDCLFGTRNGDRPAALAERTLGCRDVVGSRGGRAAEIEAPHAAPGQREREQQRGASAGNDGAHQLSTRRPKLFAVARTAP